MNTTNLDSQIEFNIQPILENETVKLLPLEEKDFEELFSVASDPKIWEQHPSRNRWKREIFVTFFEGAILSKGAFKIVNKANDKIIGSTRFFDYDKANDKIEIGYTFYATSFWGTGINSSVKNMMMNYIFQHVSKVHFHIGAENKRSQIAISRLGAKKIDEIEIPFYGEPAKLHYVYEIQKDNFF